MERARLTLPLKETDLYKTLLTLLENEALYNVSFLMNLQKIKSYLNNIMHIESYKFPGVHELALSRGTIRLHCKCDIEEMRGWRERRHPINKDKFLKNFFDFSFKTSVAFLISPFLTHNNRLNRHTGLQKILENHFKIANIELIEQKALTTNGKLLFIARCPFNSINYSHILEFFFFGGEGFILDATNHSPDLESLITETSFPTSLAFSAINSLIRSDFELLIFDHYIETEDFSAFKIKKSITK